MTSLAPTIEPNSDQLNSDDLIAGPRTIKITSVKAGSKEQPINISYDGDDGKPYRPSKGMRRLMVELWGDDGHQYVGRSMTLFRDPEVKFGGVKVGGIKVSAMSHIPAKTTVMLTVARGTKQEHMIDKLEDGPPPVDPAEIEAAKARAVDAAQNGTAAFTTYFNSEQGKADRPHIRPEMDRMKELAEKADAKAQERPPEPIKGSTGTEAHAAGMNAGVEAACPFGEGTQEAADWTLGWREANE